MAQTIEVKLAKTTKPKFMHNAEKAGKLPVWTYSFTDKDTKKTGSVDINMTKNMTKDENTASKMMNEAAIAVVKKNYPGATVKLA